MKRNKSFETTPFYFVATPIGNLSEFSPRAISILQEAHFICCEDTRTSGLLLNHFNIKKPLISVHKFNEKSKVDMILEKLNNGEHGAFISDAGYPLVSDPGDSLVSALLSQNISVSVVNGPSALLPALLGSGLSLEAFTFVGFLKGNTKEVTKTLNNLKNRHETLVFYEAPHRVVKTINDIYNVFGERRLVIARELTKIHEEYIYTTLKEFTTSPLLDLKGEIVLVIEGYQNSVETPLDEYLAQVETLINSGYKTKEAISVIALLSDVSKNALYDAYLKRHS